MKKNPDAPVLAELDKLETAELVKRLAQVGVETNAAAATLKEWRAKRMLLLVTLEKRAVSYRRMAAIAGMTDVTLARGLERYHQKLHPEPIV